MVEDEDYRRKAKIALVAIVLLASLVVFASFVAFAYYCYIRNQVSKRRRNSHKVEDAANLNEKKASASQMWLVLIGIAPGSPERPQPVKENMQLFVVEQQSQALEAHTAPFASFRVTGNDKDSILICFASKTINAGQVTSKMHVIELGAQLDFK
ncbi:hypothetical protein KIW84_045818 [Lathyrus oleraceus]|uniref:Uncharacterized protein n=1 Tax=Pisum sativum TaxID=3888 RepID=A0A9D4XJI7_PEA|nr:hypothetical protein KIW84_045818 [Pisum sativum]